MCHPHLHFPAHLLRAIHPGLGVLSHWHRGAWHGVAWLARSPSRSRPEARKRALNSNSRAEARRRACQCVPAEELIEERRISPRGTFAANSPLLAGLVVSRATAPCRATHPTVAAAPQSWPQYQYQYQCRRYRCRVRARTASTGRQNGTTDGAGGGWTRGAAAAAAAMSAGAIWCASAELIPFVLSVRATGWDGSRGHGHGHGGHEHEHPFRACCCRCRGRGRDEVSTVSAGEIRPGRLRSLVRFVVRSAPRRGDACNSGALAAGEVDVGVGNDTMSDGSLGSSVRARSRSCVLYQRILIFGLLGGPRRSGLPFAL